MAKAPLSQFGLQAVLSYPFSPRWSQDIPLRIQAEVGVYNVRRAFRLYLSETLDTGLRRQDERQAKTQKGI